MNFQPWIGDRYGSNNSLGLPARLLVLGESHYGANARPDITKEVVGEVFDEGVSYRYRFFTSVFKAVLEAEREPTREALEEFCRAIAFYNFIQEMMPTAGDRPTGTQWTCAAVPFFECLEKVNPSHVVACGFELWANLPSERFSWLSGETEAHLLGRLPTQYQDSAQHRKHGWVGRYDHAGGGCLILKIHHPSIAFSAAEWRPLLQRFFQLEVD